LVLASAVDYKELVFHDYDNYRWRNNNDHPIGNRSDCFFQ